MVKPNQTSSQNPVICIGSSYTLPGGTVVTAAGTYMDTIASSNGCDSVITTTLSVNSVLTSTQNPIICVGNSYTLPGGASVNTTGTYSDTLTSVNGCDSIITTNLTVNQNSSSNQSISICNGAAYQLPDGSFVATSGTYVDTIISSNGCDSIISIQVNVNPSPTAVANSSITINQGDSTLITATGGGVYQWYPSTGLSSSSDSVVWAKPFNTTQYCVVVTNSFGCKDTSCVTITVIEPPCPTETTLQVPQCIFS